MCESMLEIVLFLWEIGKEQETEGDVLTDQFWPTDATSSQHRPDRYDCARAPAIPAAGPKDSPAGNPANSLVLVVNVPCAAGSSP